MNVHVNNIIMKIKLEFLNIATGILLCIAGVIYVLSKDYTSALSWGIFGSMYLVMDSYKPYSRSEKPFIHTIREIFGVLGLLLSLLLIVYLVV